MSDNANNRMRKNPFDNEWIMYAPNRSKVQSVSDKPKVERPCPFCPGADEVGDHYEVCILPNKFPSFTSIQLTEDEEKNFGETKQDGYGRQNVFIFNEDHHQKLVDQTPERIAQLFKAIGQQVLEHYQDPKIEAIAAFENSGPEFGPSIKHPHGQMFALSFIPKRMRPEGDHCLLCKNLAENKFKDTTIKETENALLVCPPYARFPYEMHVFPKKHIASLSDLNQVTLHEIATLTKLGLMKIAAIETGTMTYMLLIYVAPKKYLNNYHLRIELVPINKPLGGRKYLGGLELGYGVFVNPSIPEMIAKELSDLKV